MCTTAATLLLSPNPRSRLCHRCPSFHPAKATPSFYRHISQSWLHQRLLFRSPHSTVPLTTAASVSLSTAPAPTVKLLPLLASPSPARDRHPCRPQPLLPCLYFVFSVVKDIEGSFSLSEPTLVMLDKSQHQIDADLPSLL
ncbi:hypothetical protein B296_00017101 [Ensete ventricosum]|uniref:Uncharacterized protein n=1 Tax=Ensete ventricosum TaxID=4639 RepID=A0A427AA16_ENSVE|nr:hypothetical protein B296_00017101 [Ensete ventricosum]